MRKSSYDPDAQWLISEIKGADNVGQIVARSEQFLNKSRALRLRYRSDHRLHHYAEEIELAVAEMKKHRWNELLVDIHVRGVSVKRLSV